MATTHAVRKAVRKRTTWFLFFFNDPATTETYTLSLHDALPISQLDRSRCAPAALVRRPAPARRAPASRERSEEHTSELQSHSDLVCRLLLEKKKHSLRTSFSLRYPATRLASPTPPLTCYVAVAS